MSTTIRANINPDILVWARKTSGYSLEEAASKMRISQDKLIAWETGAERPTIRQLRVVGRVYKRPSALFFSRDLPEAPPLLTDFRRFSEVSLEISPELNLEIRKAFQRRKIALELAEQLGEELLGFDFKADMSEAPRALAHRIIVKLQISLKEQYSWSDHYQALRAWIAAVENSGVLVFHTDNVDTVQMRGGSISQTPFPVIVLNGKDSPRGRIFSLLHEFVHIALGRGGICDLHDSDDDTEVETYCNRVAGEVLVPAEALLAESMVKEHHSKTWDDYVLSQLANRYMVSAEVILRRLLILGKTTEQEYRKKRDEYMEAYLKRSKEGGFIHYYKRVLRNNGRAYTSLVLSSYYNNEISYRDLSNFLGGVKLTHIPAIEQELAKGVERGDGF